MNLNLCIKYLILATLIFKNTSIYAQSFIGVGNLTISSGKESRKYGVTDRKGKIIIPFEYDLIDGVKDRPFVVAKNNRYGLISFEGKIIIPAHYETIGRISDKMFYIKLNSKYGILDGEGKELFPIKYRNLNIQYIQYGLLTVIQTDGTEFVIDENGKTILGTNEKLHGFSSGIAWVEKNRRFGVIGPYGVRIIDYIYEDGSFFYYGFAAAKKNGKYGLINKNGEEMCGFKYDSLKSDYNHFWIAKKKWQIWRC